MIPLFIEGEQVNLLVKPKNSSSIAGAAALQVFPSQIAIVDFYILEHYRHRGAGRILMKAIESLAIRRGIRKINTGRSLHSDNREMIEFLKKMKFVKLPLEIYHFSQSIKTQEGKIHRFSSIIIPGFYLKIITFSPSPGSILILFTRWLLKSLPTTPFILKLLFIRLF